MVSLDEIEAAARNVYAAMAPTPQYAWPLAARRAGREVWVKHENHTPTGAFKVRGGLNLLARLAALRPRPAGLISATRGNHGQSLAYAARRYGVRCVIVVPHGNSLDKNEAMRAFGAAALGQQRPGVLRRGQHGGVDDGGRRFDFLQGQHGVTLV